VLAQHPRDVTVTVTHEQRRPAGCQNAVDFARNDQPFQCRQQAHKVNVRGRQAVAEQLDRLVGLKEKVVEPLGADRLPQRLRLGATAGNEKGKARIGAQQAGRVHQGVKLMGPTQITRIADHKTPLQPEALACLAGRARLRHDTVGVRPVGDDPDFGGCYAGIQHATPHAFAEHDVHGRDPQGAVTGSDQLPLGPSRHQARCQDGGDFGKQILQPVDQHRAAQDCRE